MVALWHQSWWSLLNSSLSPWKACTVGLGDELGDQEEERAAFRSPICTHLAPSHRLLWPVKPCYLHLQLIGVAGRLADVAYFSDLRRSSSCQCGLGARTGKRAFNGATLTNGMVSPALTRAQSLTLNVVPPWSKEDRREPFFPGAGVMAPRCFKMPPGPAACPFGRQGPPPTDATAWRVGLQAAVAVELACCKIREVTPARWKEALSFACDGACTNPVLCCGVKKGENG